MRLRMLLVAGVVLVMASPAVAQSRPRKTLQERIGTPAARVVQRHLDLEGDAGQLTPEGWAAIAALFQDPGPRTVTRRLAVVEHMEVFDTALVPGGAAADVGVHTCANGTYDVRSGIYSTDGFGGPIKTKDDVRVVRVGNAWKIAGPVPPPMVTWETVLRLATELRDTTTDPKIKRNASRTIAALKRYH